MELVRVVIPSHTLQNVFCRRPTSRPPYADVLESAAKVVVLVEYGKVLRESGT